MTDITEYMDAEQLQALGQRKRQPVNSRKVVLDNIEFDSQVEAGRYQELRLLERAGDIQRLNVHHEFVIQKQCTRWGNTVRKRTYTYDNFYWDVEAGRWIVEDVKGKKRTKTGKWVAHVSRDFYLRFDLARVQYPDYDFQVVLR